MISKKQLMLALCAVSLQNSLFALQKASNVVADWDDRISNAGQLNSQLRMARSNQEKKQAELNDYCNSKFGFHGRLLSQYLTDSQKRQVYNYCGDAMKDKNPKAYEAVQGAGQTKAALKAKYAESGSAQDLLTNATAVKERARARAGL